MAVCSWCDGEMTTATRAPSTPFIGMGVALTWFPSATSPGDK